MTGGRWQMADGRWQIADDRWQMAERFFSFLFFILGPLAPLLCFLCIVNYSLVFLDSVGSSFFLPFAICHNPFSDQNYYYT